MNNFEERRNKLIERSRIRKEQEIKDFLDNVNKIYNKTNESIIPNVSIMKEYDNNYISYHVVKHPNCYSYSLYMYKKEYPFNIYYSKEFYKNGIPKKYIKEFEMLEEYFIKEE